MPLLSRHGVASAFHYTPLHYLPFIARPRRLLSKRPLRCAGFSDSHFRSTSKAADEERGFGDYVHLSLTRTPPLLKAKLAKGFPHIEFAVPTAAIEERTYHLCRYNIAKTRYLRRGDTAGFTESPRNGRYHDNKQIPMAQTPEELTDLFRLNHPHTMIEVLVPLCVHLPANTGVTFFHKNDLRVGRSILEKCDVAWTATLSDRRYDQSETHFENALAFARKTLSDPSWRGDGLEFDRL